METQSTRRDDYDNYLPAKQRAWQKQLKPKCAPLLYVALPAASPEIPPTGCTRSALCPLPADPRLLPSRPRRPCRGSRLGDEEQIRASSFRAIISLSVSHCFRSEQSAGHVWRPTGWRHRGSPHTAQDAQPGTGPAHQRDPTAAATAGRETLLVAHLHLMAAARCRL